MSKTVNVAMIGLGFGAEFIPIYQSHAAANVYAICRRNEAELNKTGDQFGIEKRFAIGNTLFDLGFHPVVGYLDSVHVFLVS